MQCNSEFHRVGCGSNVFSGRGIHTQHCFGCNFHLEDIGSPVCNCFYDGVDGGILFLLLVPGMDVFMMLILCSASDLLVSWESAVDRMVVDGLIDIEAPSTGFYILICVLFVAWCE